MQPYFRASRQNRPKGKLAKEHADGTSLVQVSPQLKYIPVELVFLLANISSSLFVRDLGSLIDLEGVIDVMTL